MLIHKGVKKYLLILGMVVVMATMLLIIFSHSYTKQITTSLNLKRTLQLIKTQESLLSAQNIREEIIFNHNNLYLELMEPPNKEKWLDELKSIQNKLVIAPLQVMFSEPQPIDQETKNRFNLKYSQYEFIRVQLKLGLQTDLDLPVFFKYIQKNASNLYEVESCKIQYKNQDKPEFNPNKGNLLANCNLLMIYAKYN